MALGRQGGRQSDLIVGWAELPRSPGHAFYDRLQAVLIDAGPTHETYLLLFSDRSRLR